MKNKYCPKPPSVKGVPSADGGGCRPYNSDLTPYARELRTNATKQENHLWYDFLRNYRPRFSRQRIVGKYILDFYCAESFLAIEIDGSQHFEPDAMEYDKIRTEFLNEWGINVIRFTNLEIDRNFNAVCDMINKIVKERQPPPSADGTPFTEGGFMESGVKKC